ncbi:MAG: hypothetical protein ACRYGI_03570 [Janthinobacterium lividum]
MALLSGLAALSILILPLMLVLLMVLFDTVAHGLLVLLGLLVTWLRQIVQVGATGLPPYDTIAFAPLDVALRSLFRSLPCLAGLMLVLLRQRPGRSWWLVVVLWGLSASIGGEVVAVALLPGIGIAIWFALPHARFS